MAVSEMSYIGGGGVTEITILEDTFLAKGTSATETIDLSKRYVINYAQLRADRGELAIWTVINGVVTQLREGVSDKPISATATLSGTTLTIANTHGSDGAFYSVMEV